VAPRDDDASRRRRSAEALEVRNRIAELERLRAGLDRELELEQRRLVELVPVGSRTPSAHEIAVEIVDYLEEKTNPGIEPPPRRLPPPPPAPHDSDRVRRKVVEVLDEGKARRWDDLSRTSRHTIVAVVLAALLGVVGRLLEAAIRGHW
jgi:hypothetical protein